MIEHTVTFSLKHRADSPEEKNFFEVANELSTIPGVSDFKIRRQISGKNNHKFGISMMFDNAADLQTYCDHPLHMAFIEKHWLSEVSDFQEADFVEL